MLAAMQSGKHVVVVDVKSPLHPATWDMLARTPGGVTDLGREQMRFGPSYVQLHPDFKAYFLWQSLTLPVPANMLANVLVVAMPFAGDTFARAASEVVMRSEITDVVTETVDIQRQ